MVKSGAGFVIHPESPEPSPMQEKRAGSFFNFPRPEGARTQQIRTFYPKVSGLLHRHTVAVFAQAIGAVDIATAIVGVDPAFALLWQAKAGCVFGDAMGTIGTDGTFGCIECLQAPVGHRWLDRCRRGAAAIVVFDDPAKDI